MKRKISKYIDADKMLEEYKQSYIYDTIDLAEMLNYMPAADVVEVRHGHWIDVECYSERCDDRYICSECRRITYRTMTSYCPNCGAKMDEVIQDVDLRQG